MNYKFIVLFYVLTTERTKSKQTTNDIVKLI